MDERDNDDNFSIHHHELNRKSCEIKLAWWENEISQGRRCGRCWLRNYECFCDQFDVIAAERPTVVSAEDEKAKVCMYYHYQEIGRSANTAHVFQALNSCETVIYGDSTAEIKLLNDIATEIVTGTPTTCILYPSNDAISLNEWMTNRAELHEKKQTSSGTTSPKLPPIRIVVLDGTYNQAKRQWKYLTKALQTLSASYNHSSLKLPVVKLDLEKGRCKSAILGIMSQPGKDKVCSYQAAVMALRQAGVSQAACDFHARNLDKFLQHILSTKIKFGKMHNKGLADMDYTPADYVVNHLVSACVPFSN